MAGWLEPASLITQISGIILSGVAGVLAIQSDKIDEESNPREKRRKNKLVRNIIVLLFLGVPVSVISLVFQKILDDKDKSELTAKLKES